MPARFRSESSVIGGYSTTAMPSARRGLASEQVGVKWRTRSEARIAVAGVQARAVIEKH